MLQLLLAQKPRRERADLLVASQGNAESPPTAAPQELRPPAPARAARAAPSGMLSLLAQPRVLLQQHRAGITHSLGIICQLAPAASSAASQGQRSAAPHRDVPLVEPEGCTICTETLGVSGVGRLDCCDHSFCFHCISQWVKQDSSCPLCKGEVRRLSRVDAAGVQTEEHEVPYRRQSPEGTPEEGSDEEGGSAEEGSEEEGSDDEEMAQPLSGASSSSWSRGPQGRSRRRAPSPSDRVLRPRPSQFVLASPPHPPHLAPGQSGGAAHVAESMIEGHGLFASRDIEAGEEVVRFGAGTEMAAAQWPAHCQGKGLPLWGAFHSGRPGVGVAYDPTWQSMSQRPKWSYLNAASDPNAEMDPTSWPLLVCRAKRRICVGEEICISYGEHP